MIDAKNTIDMKKKFAVVLSGCGVYDGSEIGEAMMTLLALEEAGCDCRMFAPDKPQLRVMDHLRGKEAEHQTRNVLTESARIARGNVAPLASYRPEEFDGLVFVGGFGAATNLSDFAVAGSGMEVDPEVARAVEETNKAGKMLAAMCIAPVILAKLLPGVKVTAGHDPATNQALAAMGAEPVDVFEPDVVEDTRYKVYTTPCYMLPDATLATVAACCRKLVSAMLA